MSKRMNLVYQVLIILGFLCAFTTVQGDTLYLHDGSILNGKILHQKKQSMVFKTEYAGTIAVKWQSIESLESDQPITILLTNNELLKTKQVKTINSDQVVVRQANIAGGQELTSIMSNQIAYINPEPWRLGKAYKFNGSSHFSLKSQHGNTIKDEFEMDGNILFRGQNDRYILEGQLERDTTDEERTADNWYLTGKYDFFISEKSYIGLTLTFEHDRFKDLDWRTAFGPHIGRQLFESYERNLSIDMGLVQVIEENINNEDTDFISLTWNIDFDHYLFHDFTQLYHKQKGLWDVEKSSKVAFTSWTGFRFPLKYGVVASAEIEWDFESKPNDNTIEKSDTTYRLKLGYQW